MVILWLLGAVAFMAAHLAFVFWILAKTIDEL